MRQPQEADLTKPTQTPTRHTRAKDTVILQYLTLVVVCQSVELKASHKSMYPTCRTSTFVVPAGSYKRVKGRRHTVEKRLDGRPVLPGRPVPTDGLA